MSIDYVVRLEQGRTRRLSRPVPAVLRMEAGRTPDDRALTALVGELTVRDPDFRTWWGSHQVRGPRQLTKTYRHPVIGTVTLDVQQFCIDTRPDQQLVAYTTPPDSPSQESLRFFLQWSAHPAAQPDDRTTDRSRRR